MQFAAHTHSYYLAVPAAIVQLLETCRVPNHHHTVLHVGNAAAVRNGFEHIATMLRGSSGSEQMRCLARMQDFIADIHQRAQAQREDQPIIDQACTLLRDRHDLSIQHIAAACNMPYSSFRLLFQQRMGCTAQQWRQRCRIEQAQHWLHNSEQSLADIAHELGYADASHFSSDFKKATGKSPRAWRKNRISIHIRFAPTGASEATLLVHAKHWVPRRIFA